MTTRVTVADLRGYLDGAPDDMPVLVQGHYLRTPQVIFTHLCYEPRNDEWFPEEEIEPADRHYVEMRKALVIK